LRPRPKDIAKLKKPLGQLLTGDPSESVPKLLRLLQKEKPPSIIAVGDVVSREIWKAGVPVDLRIVDQRSMRLGLEPSNLASDYTYRVENPAGVITTQAWEVIRKSLARSGAVVLVDGEEDLLAIPCILEATDGSFIIYGQPDQGMVVVKSTEPIKQELAAMVRNMIREET
jgi:hypothetical protein